MLTNQERPSRSPTTPPLLRTRILFLLGALLVIAGLLSILYWLPVLDQTHPDFLQDYRAANRLLEGRPIYDAAITNNHPPFNAILFVPMAFLSQTAALKLWTLLSVVIYLSAGYWIARLLAITLPPVGWVVVIGIALCWYPFQAHLALGQISLLLVACLIGGWVLLRRGQAHAAALLFALAFLVKLFPGLIFLYLLLRRKQRAFLAAAVATVVGWGLVLWLVGLDDTWLYFTEVAPAAAGEYRPYPINVSITSLPARFLGDGYWIEPITVQPQLVPPVTIFFAAVVLIVLAAQVWLLPHTEWGDDIAFGLVCLAMPLLSPISWQHIFPLLALPLGLLYVQALRTSGEERSRRLITLFVIFVLLSLPDIQLANHIMMLYAPQRMPWYAGLLFTLPTVAMCALWYMLWQHRQAE
jgi:hypothetical protein